MEFKNFTPFAGDAWETVNGDNQWYATSLVRAAFKLQKGEDNGEWLWQPKPDQGDVFGEDEFYREDIDSSVRYESDYVNFKPFSDVVVNATTRAPTGQPQSKWTCSVQVLSPEEPSTKKRTLLNELYLQVQGPQDPLLRKKVTSVPIRYEKCQGGILKIKNRDREDEQVSVDLHNPVGCGKYALEDRDGLCSVQIDYDRQGLRNIPAGFGFIHRSWKSRLDHAGTYDQYWIDHQHPLPPKDFGFFHNQAAHPALITNAWLQAGSRIVLGNLIQGEAESHFDIPDYRFLSRVSTNTDQRHDKMNLDTLLIDIDNEDPAEFTIYASWRSYTRLMGTAISAETMMLPNESSATGLPAEALSTESVRHG